MKNYKFDTLNGGITIKDATATWESAAFSIVGDGLMTLGIKIENSNTTYGIELSKVGHATDRSDEAIEQLMNYLLTPYIVK